MPPIRTLAAAAALALAASTPLHAADLPANRPITLIVPFAAGGGVDGMGRLLAERLRSELPQGVVVENKPGASGMLGATAVVRSAPTARRCCWDRPVRRPSIRSSSRARCSTSRKRIWRRSR